MNLQLGLEPTPEAYVANMVAVFREVRRVLREDGTCWVNMGDSYATGTTSDRLPTQTGKHGYWENPAVNKRIDGREIGLKPKDLIGMPWRLAFALQADGWWLRSDIIWAKPNPMPESVTDRPTKSHEYIFLLTKSARYFWDAEAVKEPSETTVHRLTDPTDEYKAGKTPSEVVGRPVQRGGKALAYAYPNGLPFRNLRSVWTIATQPYPEAHFATFPEEIPKRCILAGTSARGCCATCGAPWERVVERTATGAVQKMADGWDTGPGGHSTVHRTGRQAGETGKPVLASNTIGFRPTCSCKAPTRPCLVLDPFVGSGTTVSVAESLGRRGIGLELKPEYIALAKRRCRVTIGLAF